MPKYIAIPSDVAFKNPLDGQSTGEKMTFAEFVRGKLLVHPRWMQSYTDLRAAHAIDDALSNSTRTIVLDEAVWKKLAETCQSPQYQLPTPLGPQVQSGLLSVPALLAPQLLPFFDAILTAKDAPPESVSA
ncbi:MAG TPA: hypothetical protein VJ891_15410 [Casimicrobiaceae bacterium]|nr:hypothetical protein [Casimicrobiaceae bacterium]